MRSGSILDAAGDTPTMKSMSRLISVGRSDHHRQIAGTAHIGDGIARMTDGGDNEAGIGEVGYKELADRLNKHGLQETETSITGKLARGTFATSFFLASLTVLEMEGVRLEDL